MEALNRLWTREGPGIPKGQAAPVGLALLGATVRREAVGLLALNALMLVSCLPLVTIPAAHAAGARVTLRMLDDEPTDLWRTYWRAFAACLVPATVTGLAAGALVAGGLWAAWIYGQLALADPLFALPMVVAICVSLGLACTGLGMVAGMARDPAPRLGSLPGLLRRAARATLVRPGRLLAGLAAVCGLWGLTALFFPVSVLPAATLNLALGCLLATFAARSDADANAGVTRAISEEETL